jgi:hypothetical protein
MCSDKFSTAVTPVGLIVFRRQFDLYMFILIVGLEGVLHYAWGSFYSMACDRRNFTEKQT